MNILLIFIKKVDNEKTFLLHTNNAPPVLY